ncbi:7168_t:CDS:1, partial [Dentiscutata heterogama]
MEQNNSRNMYDDAQTEIDTDGIDYLAIETNEIQGQTSTHQETDAHLSENEKRYSKNSSSQSHKKKSNRRSRNQITVETKKDIMKTSELQALLPRRRRVKYDPKGKRAKYSDTSENDDIDEDKHCKIVGSSKKRTKYKPDQKEKANKRGDDENLDE